MSVLPPPFIIDPVAAVLALSPDDDEFMEPEHFGREAAELVLDRDDAAMAEALGRAWRSGAPEGFLDTALITYASVHEVDLPEIEAIGSAAHFVRLVRASIPDVELLAAVGDAVPAAVYEALATAQGDDDPCACPPCIASAAALN